MSRERLGRTRLPWIKNAKFLIYSTQHSGVSGWWLPRMNGYSHERMEAAAFSYADAMTLSHQSYLFLYVTKPGPPEPEDPNVPKRRCNIISFVGAVVCAGLQAQPKNETFRAKLMAITGQMPPAELDTFAKLKDWVEFNFPKQPAKTPKDVVYEGRFTYELMETGRCRFHRTTRFTGMVKLTGKDIVECADGCGDIEEVINCLADRMRENLDESGGDNSEEISCNTDRHEVEESSNEECDYNYTTLRKSIVAYLRTCEPELAEEFGLNE